MYVCVLLYIDICVFMNVRFIVAIFNIISDNIRPKDKDEFVMIRNKELSNGRLATIGG